MFAIGVPHKPQHGDGRHGRFFFGTRGVARGTGWRRWRRISLHRHVQTFISTVQAVVLQSASFFWEILRQGNFVNPLIFAIICYEVSAILGACSGWLESGRTSGSEGT